ncbi:MAG: P-loop NTPase [Archaeoglobaceae archaeon]
MVKIGICGKGGVGKTTLAAVLAHMFAEEGYSVTAIDCDSSFNLPHVLGIAENIKPLSELKDIIQERVVMEGGMFRYNPKVDDVFRDHSVLNEDEVRVAVLGTIEKGGEGCFCPENAFLKAILRYAIFKSDEVLILDMEAGIEHLGRGTAKGVDLLIAVVEPGMRSFETLRRIRRLAKDIGISKLAVVVNKFLDTEESRDMVDKLDAPVLGIIPFDQCFIEADLKNEPPYKFCSLDKFVEIKDNLMALVGDSG